MHSPVRNNWTSLNFIVCFLNFLCVSCVYRWTPIGTMKKQRSASGICAFNSMVYAAGGHDGYRIFASVECYDTRTDSWAFVAPMGSRRCRLGLSGLGGKLYAAGGYDSLAFLDTVERYDPAEDRWQFVASMGSKRSRMVILCPLFFLLWPGCGIQENLTSKTVSNIF